MVETLTGADQIYYQSAHLASQVNQGLKAMKNDRLKVSWGQRQRSGLTREWTKEDPKASSVRFSDFVLNGAERFTTASTAVMRNKGCFGAYS